jgi:hypothetical protein
LLVWDTALGRSGRNRYFLRSFDVVVGILDFGLGDLAALTLVSRRLERLRWDILLMQMANAFLNMEEGGEYPIVQGGGSVWGAISLAKRIDLGEVK